jgi:hypothetical protein
MPVDELHARVAEIALHAAGRHGFALAGGNALIAHGITSRPTADVDLFTDQERGVEAASESIEKALVAAGFQAEKQDKTGGLADLFPGMGYGMAEWAITAPGGAQITLQLAYFDRKHRPVTMALGPVLDLADVAAWKTAAIVNRADPRDYVDLAALLNRYTVDQLLDMARKVDPGLEESDIARVGSRLDELSDSVFLRLYELGPRQVATIRQRFAAWPRARSRRRRA